MIFAQNSYFKQSYFKHTLLRSKVRTNVILPVRYTYHTTSVTYRNVIVHCIQTLLGAVDLTKHVTFVCILIANQVLLPLYYLFVYQTKF